jgi:hypothetical protein
LPENVALIPEVPAEILKTLTPSEDVAINSARLSIQWLNELASKLPDRYHWRFRNVEAFNAELKEMLPPAKDALPLNRLYWQDALGNCEAYSAMASWRVVELARSCVWALARRDLLCSALMARSALESTAQYVDFARQVNATLEGIPDVDLRKTLNVSREFESLLVKTIFSARRSDTDEIYKPTNILTIIARIAKIPGQQNISSHYEILCEIAHPNFLGRSVHIHEFIPGARPGDELRIIGPGQAGFSLPVMGAIVAALSWACATHVTAFGLMRSTIESFFDRFNREPS